MLKNIGGFTTSVTQEHIDRSDCGNPHHCMLATALLEQFPGSKVYVSYGSVTERVLVTINEDEYRFQSEDLVNYLSKYDNEQEVSPFTLSVQKVLDECSGEETIGYDFQVAGNEQLANVT